ncbi:hypothetical protein DPEC_G00232940 [Dallia pectoralis]|uniref:Uncharacterized protein n=1 Tax=Dallia pectoralis TaxID=75939 RepID=A0ACC2FX72_DALPE|nr:hypothetical protein DPEC_G00232940 [Dallia pectoralis]
MVNRQEVFQFAVRASKVRQTSLQHKRRAEWMWIPTAQPGEQRNPKKKERVRRGGWEGKDQEEGVQRDLSFLWGLTGPQTGNPGPSVDQLSDPVSGLFRPGLWESQEYYSVPMASLSSCFLEGPKYTQGFCSPCMPKYSATAADIKHVLFRVPPTGQSDADALP